MQARDLGRVVAFSDGVMAVAITLLVLNVEVPEVSGADLPGALGDLLPSLLAYLLSFALVGRYWVIHHNLYETLVGFDGRLMALNLVFLMLIALMPFGADLIDEYPEEAVAAATFAVAVALAALTHWVAARYSLSRGFVNDALEPETARFAGAVSLGFSAIFFLSAPVAFLSVTAAQCLWLSTFFLRYPLRRLADRSSQ